VQKHHSKKIDAWRGRKKQTKKTMGERDNNGTIGREKRRNIQKKKCIYKESIVPQLLIAKD